MYILQYMKQKKLNLQNRLESHEKTIVDSLEFGAYVALALRGAVQVNYIIVTSIISAIIPNDIVVAEYH